VAQAQYRGFIYIFFYSIPSNTAISVFPHEPVLIFCGQYQNLYILSLAATLGTIVAGYIDFQVFVPILNYKKIIGYKQKRFYQISIKYFNKFPFWTLVIAGFTPVPFFLFKFFAFSVHYPLWKYLSAVVVGRFPRYFLLAWLGLTLNIPSEILITIFVVIFLAYLVKTAIKFFKSLILRIKQKINLRNEEV
jgi:membrane protein YqaA with SNARE-associated domain